MELELVMVINNWSLRDAELEKYRFPYTFYKPSDGVLGKLKIGDVVKLVVDYKMPGGDVTTAESISVEIIVLGGEKYTGRLLSKPDCVEGVGPLVEFEGRNIIDTSYLDNKCGELGRYAQHCKVANGVFYEYEKIFLLKRAPPDKDRDSGWTMLGENDFGEFIDDPYEMALVSIGAVLNIEDTFIHLLDEPIGSEFLWDKTKNSFVKCT